MCNWADQSQWSGGTPITIKIIAIRRQLCNHFRVIVYNKVKLLVIDNYQIFLNVNKRSLYNLSRIVIKLIYGVLTSNEYQIIHIYKPVAWSHTHSPFVATLSVKHKPNANRWLHRTKKQRTGLSQIMTEASFSASLKLATLNTAPFLSHSNIAGENLHVLSAWTAKPQRSLTKKQGR